VAQFWLITQFHGDLMTLDDISPRLWPVAPPPPSSPCWSWAPRGLAELPAVRRELRRSLADEPMNGPQEHCEDLYDRMVLLLDELLSNALRHGAAPVAADVRRVGGAWLLMVSDRAARMPPHPDPDRDPARGGLGLRLVSELANAYGWCSDGRRKHVWAVLALSG
jgi:hypothetical protein